MRVIDRLHAAYWLWRARGALKSGDPARAGACAEIVAEIAPDLPALGPLEREVREAAAALARRRVQEEPDEPEWRGDYARALLEGERYPEAAVQVRAGLRLLRADRKRARLKAEMLQIAGEIEYHLGHLRRAIDLLTRGEEPGFAMAGIHYYRGLAWLALGDERACRREFTPLVQKAHWAVAMRQEELKGKGAE